MFTKTIKKYMALGLVLAFCSASSMASETKTLTASQYQPALVGGYGLAEGISVTGTTLVGCGTMPAYIILPILESAATPSTPFNIHANEMVMDLLTKAKAASRPIKVTYSPISESSSECSLESVLMQ